MTATSLINDTCPATTTLLVSPHPNVIFGDMLQMNSLTVVSTKINFKTKRQSSSTNHTPFL